MVTWLPFYLVRERHYSMTAMAKIGGGFFSRGRAFGEHLWMVVGSMDSRGQARPRGYEKGSWWPAAWDPERRCWQAVVIPGAYGIVLLMLAGAFFGSRASNIWAITQRLAGPKAVGRWCGLQLFVGNSSGVLSPAVAGFLLDRTGHFFWPFLIVSLFVWVGALSWIFMVGPVEPVEWGESMAMVQTAEAVVSTA